MQDGLPGSKRLCVVQEDFFGESWEEEIITANVCERRRLTVDNLKGFSVKASHLFTDQYYESMEGNKTRLYFKLYLKPESIFDYAKFTFFGPYIAGVFAKNLSNIKEILENTSA